MLRFTKYSIDKTASLVNRYHNWTEVYSKTGYFSWKESSCICFHSGGVTDL